MLLIILIIRFLFTSRDCYVLSQTSRLFQTYYSSDSNPSTKITSTISESESKSPELKELNEGFEYVYMRKEEQCSGTVSGNFGRGKVDHKTYKDQVTGGSNGRAARALLLRPIISFSLPLPPFSFFLCLAIR